MIASPFVPYEGRAGSVEFPRGALPSSSPSIIVSSFFLRAGSGYCNISLGLYAKVSHQQYGKIASQTYNLRVNSILHKEPVAIFDLRTISSPIPVITTPLSAPEGNGSNLSTVASKMAGFLAFVALRCSTRSTSGALATTRTAVWASAHNGFSKISEYSAFARDIKVGSWTVVVLSISIEHVKHRLHCS